MNFPQHEHPTWPRYLVSIVDREVKCDLAGSDLTVYALIAVNQGARMERYLAGNDNPIHDLVEELRYNPAFIGEPVRKAAKSFADSVAE